MSIFSVGSGPFLKVYSSEDAEIKDNRRTEQIHRRKLWALSASKRPPANGLLAIMSLCREFVIVDFILTKITAAECGLLDCIRCRRALVDEFCFDLQHGSVFFDQVVGPALSRIRWASLKGKSTRSIARKLKVGLALVAQQSFLNILRLADEYLIIEVVQPIHAGLLRRAGANRIFGEIKVTAIRLPRHLTTSSFMARIYSLSQKLSIGKSTKEFIGK